MTNAPIPKWARRNARIMRGQPPASLWFSIFWLAWVLGAVGVELAALASGTPGASLSENVWRYITGNAYPAVIPKSAAWVGRAVIAAFLIWLIPHLTLGWWST
jgi:hypothetical protein